MIVSETIGDIIDKLIVENLKIFNLRELIKNTNDVSEISKILITIGELNNNRNILKQEIDDRFKFIAKGEIEIKRFKRIKTL
jgi:hypothetical protein